MIQKLKKIYRILFPKKIDAQRLFEYRLKTNPLISTFLKKEQIYNLKLNSGLNLNIRGHNHSDYNVFQQIFNNEEYQIVVDIFKLNDFDKKGRVLIDAGANIGFTSIYFLSHFNNLKLIFVEPSDENMNLCLSNVKRNFDQNDVVPYHNALSENNNTKFKVHRDFRDSLDWSISTTQDENGTIHGITLNEIVKQNNLEEISILKIDIEGAERFIFKDGNDLRFLSITRVIAMEIHDEFEIRKSINQILVNNNFFIFNYGELTIGVNKDFI
ncbi:FkbM family methyltransferase [Winogradskyella alexanderae]|uniref:FkbM family methyltransferase n=1 Tax=Winogradskyella alexanderae TaxID=2877123 RepID=A0ABS7XR56_9FLAO|nr:FkbM family methyltransferase [Winogradskyella alexanderae]MCA0131984.1 FkbM family methyltransferase [Winogradskyella alexanderae]